MTVKTIYNDDPTEYDFEEAKAYMMEDYYVIRYITTKK